MKWKIVESLMELFVLRGELLSNFDAEACLDADLSK